jgi:hypothetical protein
MTPGTLIARALKLIGALGAGETADADDALDALATANDLVDSWKLDPLWIFTLARVTKDLVSGTATYTIGSGGSINTERPVWIADARLVLNTGVTPPTEVPLEVFTDQRWQGISEKTLSGQPTGIFYDRAWSAGLGTVNVHPVTNVGTQRLVLYLPSNPVSSFADLTTDYTFPPGYGRALRFNLAVELAPEYGKAVPPEVAMIAVDSLAKIKSANLRPVELVCDPGLVAATGRGGAFNWMTGEPS